ncbi:transcription initiation factor TFIIH subunit 2 [Nematocida sp. AWRm77]|nr:transcription initiation factor TFIIH subunit 2 [Nematocida sp. AWRm77]
MEESRFRWEEKFQNTWDNHTAEETSHALQVHRRVETLQRGVVRKVLLVLDMSSSIEERDFLPSRKWHLKNSVLSFYREFTESNPLSTMGVVVVSEGAAHLVTSILSNEESLAEYLDGMEGQGKFSLSAALESAYAFFQNTSFLKEVVLVAASISFFGKSPYQIAGALIEKGVKIHTVHMLGEMEVLKRISQESEGMFGVVEKPEDLSTLLSLLTVPSPHNTSGRLSMVKVGFPKPIKETSICACHLYVTETGYECPFCTTKVCSIPGVCPICEGILSAAVHLLKALHWTDSAPVFTISDAGTCRVCSTACSSTQKCPECSTKLCLSCSTFVRHKLNFCMFCADK